MSSEDGMFQLNDAGVLGEEEVAALSGHVVGKPLLLVLNVHLDPFDGHCLPSLQEGAFGDFSIRSLSTVLQEKEMLVEVEVLRRVEDGRGRGEHLQFLLPVFHDR